MENVVLTKLLNAWSWHLTTNCDNHCLISQHVKKHWSTQRQIWAPHIVGPLRCRVCKGRQLHRWWRWMNLWTNFKTRQLWRVGIGNVLNLVIVGFVILYVTILHELCMVKRQVMCATSVVCWWKEVKRMLRQGPNILTVHLQSVKAAKDSNWPWHALDNAVVKKWQHRWRQGQHTGASKYCASGSCDLQERQLKGHLRQLSTTRLKKKCLRSSGHLSSIGQWPTQSPLLHFPAASTAWCSFGCHAQNKRPVDVCCHNYHQHKSLVCSLVWNANHVQGPTLLSAHVNRAVFALLVLFNL